MAKTKTQLHYNGPDLKGGRNVGSSDAHAFRFIFLFSYPFFCIFFLKKHEVLKSNHSSLQIVVCVPVLQPNELSHQFVPRLLR